jgi:adenylosuccinate synthase
VSKAARAAGAAQVSGAARAARGTVARIGAMPAIILVGLQFGDEGKGKITDMLARSADAVVRFQGGANAGHQVIWGEQSFSFRLVPSGVLSPGKLNLLGPGTVVDVPVLLGELEALSSRGIDTQGVKVSANAHVIMPYHKFVDESLELRLGKRELGTTRNGIGPAYADKALRIGIRIQDLLDERILREKLMVALEVNKRIRSVWQDRSLDLHRLVEENLVLGAELQPRIADTTKLIWNLLDRNKNVMLEGGQGSQLDIDHGTYPFVTSSNTVASAASHGAGVGPGAVQEIWGVAKAYTTRVGSGPFPAELHGDPGPLIQERGHEFGTNTGRERRVGWLDLVALKHFARLNSVTHLAITKLDVLSGIGDVGFTVAYTTGPDGAEFTDYPYHQTMLHKAEPVVKHLPGWDEDITAVTNWDELPAAARAALEFIEEFINLPIAVLSVGPERDQTLWSATGRDSLLAGSAVGRR